jgi:enoyl-CoA hydratase/carnithine racemase
MSGQVRCTIDGVLAQVELSHPGKFNAMSRAMWRELKQVFQTLQQRDDVRCVVVVGEGGHFCAGGDISEYEGFRFEENTLRDFHEQDVWGGLNAMLRCDIPLIARIQGNCMGAGVEIASCCDVRLASRDARFGAPIARLGFPMAPREAQLVAREVGVPTAREMLLEAAVFTADEMHSRAFLSAVWPATELAAMVLERAMRLTSLAPQAARLNKQTMRRLAEVQLADDLLTGAYAYAGSAEHREGISAFVNKRRADF